MPSDFAVKHQLLEELVHGLLQIKTHARNIVGAAESYLPIANENATADLADILSNALKVEQRVKALYDRNVKSAFGEQNGEPQVPQTAPQPPRA